MDLRDALTREWFRPETVRVYAQAPELTGWIDLDILVCLSGAPRESVLWVSLIDRHVIQLRVKNSQILAEDMIRLIFQSNEGFRFSIKNAAFAIAPAFRRLGLGARSFAIEALAARELGLFDRIFTTALGDASTANPQKLENQYAGYYAWARLGFDAVLTPDVLSRSTEELKACRKVSELMKTESGRRFWLQYGSTVEMSFDLDVKSSCWASLNDYMLGKGIRVFP